MGKKDIVTKKYLLDNERFADIFNYFIYNGEKMISPDMLSDDSTEELAAISTDDKDFFKQSIRDILKDAQ